MDEPASPFASWAGSSPADTFVVRLPEGSPLATTEVADVQLALRYGFTYRAD